MALRLAEIKCEIREVRLSNKPDHMLEVSPKGTVPILILEDKVIDESIDIVNWVIRRSSIFRNNLSSDQMDLTESLIKEFDDKFKHHLDRYKYATRYKGVNPIHHRNENVKYLTLLNSKLKYSKFLSSDELNYLDYCIFPFVRQFRNVDHIWFENLNLSKLNYWYSLIVESLEFNDIMKKYKVWESSESPLITNFIT